jgi:hypothetical protein
MYRFEMFIAMEHKPNMEKLQIWKHIFIWDYKNDFFLTIFTYTFTKILPE